MAAIAPSSLQPRARTPLAPKQLYGTTYSLLLRPQGIEVVYLDVTDVSSWNRPAKLRYAETIANPAFPVADLRALAETKGDGLFVVDNTFASPVLCRPLEHGADVVCHSATKYLNGHHDVTAGVVCASRELVERARSHLTPPARWRPLPAFLRRDQGARRMGAAAGGRHRGPRGPPEVRARLPRPAKLRPARVARQQLRGACSP
jgi:hypothetical protein